MHAKTLHLSAPRLDGDKEDKVLGMRIWARLETCWTELRKLTASLGCRPLGVLELSKPWETKSRQAVSQSKSGMQAPVKQHKRWIPKPEAHSDQSH